MIYLINESITALYGVGLIVNACVYVPQITRLYQTKHSEDVSLITFTSFNVINLVAVLYGIVLHNWLFILGNGLSLLTNTVVTLQIIQYRFVKKSNSITKDSLQIT